MAKTELEGFYDDVLTTAVEGGIGYWSVGRRYTWSEDAETSIELIEQDDGHVHGEWVLIDRAAVRKAYNLIVSDKANTLGLGDYYRNALLSAYAECDAGEVDSELADIVVQVAMLGEVRYG